MVQYNIQNIQTTQHNTTTWHNVPSCAPAAPASWLVIAALAELAGLIADACCCRCALERHAGASTLRLAQDAEAGETRRSGTLARRAASLKTQNHSNTTRRSCTPRLQLALGLNHACAATIQCVHLSLVG